MGEDEEISNIVECENTKRVLNLTGVELKEKRIRNGEIRSYTYISNLMVERNADVMSPRYLRERYKY